MKDKLLNSLLFILCVSQFSYAQGVFSVEGIVYDSRTKRPVENAEIVIEGTFFQTKTDSEGSFIIRGITKGKHVLWVSKEGHLSKKLPFSTSSQSEVDFNAIYLEMDVTELQNENLVTLSENDFVDDVDIDLSGGMLQATRDVFLTRAAFDFSQSFFKVKGYDSQYGDVLINGIRMNKMFNGRPQWNNWGGLNDVTRNQEYFNGLETTPYGFGGMLGTTHIDMRPSGFRPGLRLSTSASNRTYLGRLMATYSSGLGKSGFAYTLSASRRWAGEGYKDGTLYDSYSFFTSVEYQFNKKNSVYFTGFYTPNRRGKSAPITAEAFDLAGRKYNSYWGKQDGDIRNSRVRNVEEPVLMFNYNHDGDKFKLRFGAAWQFGGMGNSRLGYYNAPSPDPVYYRYLPSFYINSSLGANFDNANMAKEAFQNNPQLDWASLYAVNQNPERNGKSSYVLYEDSADETRTMFNAVVNHTISPTLQLDYGLNYTSSQAENYGHLLDLLGGDFHEDIDAFSDTRNDVDGNLQKGEGDRMGYNYTMNADVVDGFIQANIYFNAFKFYLSAKVGQTNYQREGLFQNERFDDSQGKSEELSFTDTGFKAGFSYKLTNRHIFKGNFSHLTKAPTVRNTFVNARENNKVVDSLISKTIYSGELSYFMRLPSMTARLTGYYSRFEDVTDINFFYVNSGVGSDFVQEVVTGIEKQHYGAELGFSYQATSEIKLTAVAAYGDYSYVDDAEVTINFDTAGAEEELINLDGELDLGTAAIKDYKVAVGPQKAYSVGVEYRAPKYWWVGMTANYLDDNYVDISTIKRTASFLENPEGGSFPEATGELLSELLEQEKLSPVYLLNLTGGKSWLHNGTYISLFASINNVFDVTYRTGGFEQSRNGNFEQAYQDVKRGAPMFGNKYWYGYGRTFFVNLAISF
ncbi:carboxypeptidase-like regulatory domain-containing protein [Galbibacter sp. EGI 63066]|uniref:carboxypeptidase-like regulatory domain-containing protein n=1 Tax=Galbibacter sp. EGI 63066 TaxID=2993559 RepID=UPI0022487A3B|nr:carboxypeptidase-like regulatory domain-containing protein [Galbibacter sp. EGI 63066]MCX2680544.1 carboxypeptidase-like regulatory domain-containing protein [Galbibacter sp. EGI 63066]